MPDISAQKNSMRKRGRIESLTSWVDSASWIVRLECTFSKVSEERAEESINSTKRT